MARGSRNSARGYPDCVSGRHEATSASKWKLLVQNDPRYVGMIYLRELQLISDMQIAP